VVSRLPWKSPGAEGGVWVVITLDLENSTVGVEPALITSR
jgi:hypothetical protein